MGGSGLEDAAGFGFDVPASSSMIRVDLLKAKEKLRYDNQRLGYPGSSDCRSTNRMGLLACSEKANVQLDCELGDVTFSDASGCSPHDVAIYQPLNVVRSHHKPVSPNAKNLHVLPSFHHGGRELPTYLQCFLLVYVIMASPQVIN